MSLWSYTVTYLSTDTDITAYVTEISDVTIPTNEIRSAEFTLRAKDGAFRTIDNSGATPKLTKFDKIKIEFTDRDNNSETHIFEVDTLRPIKDSSGNKLIVGCLGQENNLQLTHYLKNKQRVTPWEMIKDIIAVYNDNKGSAQVTIEKHDDTTGNYNDAPKFMTNNYDFTDNPTCYDALIRVIDSLGTSISNGGANDFFEMVFVEGSDNSKINIKVFSSGGTDSGVVVSNELTTPIRLTHGTEENESGRMVIGYGAQGYGSLPTDVAKYASRIDNFILYPEHVTGQEYVSGMKVQLAGNRYRANTTTTQTPPHANWDVMKYADEISNVPPSPWTYKKASLWKNSGCASGSSASSGFGMPGCWDGNLVIRDENFYRNWVHVRSNTSAFDTAYKYGDAAGGSYRGLRVLVDTTIGAAAGAFGSSNGNSGNDRNGVAYAKAIVKHNGGTYSGNEEYKNWDVIRTPARYNLCAVIDEGKNYEYDTNYVLGIRDGTSTGVWADRSDISHYNDCFHTYNTISNTTGISTISKQKGDNTWIDLDGSGSGDTGETYGTNSAVSVKYTHGVVSSILDNDPGYYKIGAWLNLMFPFPANNNNSISEGVGDLYGGGTNSKKEPATFDASGMFGLSPTGLSGYTKTDAEDIGAVESISFKCKFRVEESSTVLALIGGKFKWRCTVYDDSDNVVYQDFEIKDNDIWEQITLPISGFKPYRARTVRTIANVAANQMLTELEILERFEWQNVRMISFQNQEVYDDEGRYQNNLLSRFIANINNALTLGLSTISQIFTIDEFHFKKQLVAITAPDGTRNTEAGIIQRPNITSYEQLKQDVEVQKEIEQHQYRAFEVEQEGRNDIAPGESFHLKDEKMIDDSDSATNQIKLVNKEVHYSVNGSDGGSGGYVRRILGVKRI